VGVSGRYELMTKKKMSSIHVYYDTPFEQILRLPLAYNIMSAIIIIYYADFVKRKPLINFKINPPRAVLFYFDIV